MACRRLQTMVATCRLAAMAWVGWAAATTSRGLYCLWGITAVPTGGAEAWAAAGGQGSPSATWVVGEGAAAGTLAGAVGGAAGVAVVAAA